MTQVLVSVPNILTLSPTRRKYKLPPSSSSSSSSAAGGGASGGVQARFGVV